MNEREVAAKVARLAGEELIDRLQKNGGSKQIHQKDFGETVTNFDREVNQFIIDELSLHFPDHNMITEEAEEIDNNSEGKRWFIDPIDGTNNFVRNIPLYAVSIGYEENHVMSAGAIYDPLNRTLFDGELEKGAFQGKELLSVSDKSQLDHAFIIEGFGYKPEHQKRHAKYLGTLAASTRMRNIGTSALALAYTARGSVEGCVFNGLKSWDAAAGVVLVRAAGGRVTNFDGEDWKPGDDNLIASNGILHEELLEIVAV